MYQRHTGQLSMVDNPEMFGVIPLDSKNEWVELSRIVPFDEFDNKYADNFKSKKGQPAIDSRMALGAILIKTHYGFSDENVTAEIAMNPYLQYFIGLRTFTYKCPFDSSMMTRFRQRITPEMLAWVNDKISGRPESDDNHKGNGSGGNTAECQDNKASEAVSNEGTLTLDATCIPQNIRYPNDVSLINEAREKSDEIIDILHSKGLTQGARPRTHRKRAKNQYNSFSKNRRKSKKSIRKAQGQQLRYLKRNLSIIEELDKKDTGCVKEILSKKYYEMLQVLMALYTQQISMYQSAANRTENRIVSISQPWVRPIVRGKQNANVEFGAKVEMSVVNGYMRVDDLRWDAFNESTTLKTSVEAYKTAYGHYPERVLADKIFRTRENLSYCKSLGIHLNGPRLGKPSSDIKEQRLQKKLEWLESGERGAIERLFGTVKTRYSLSCICTRLKNTSEATIYTAVLYLNLRKRLRLLLRSLVSFIKGEMYHLDLLFNYGNLLRAAIVQ